MKNQFSTLVTRDNHKAKKLSAPHRKMTTMTHNHPNTLYWTVRVRTKESKYPTPTRRRKKTNAETSHELGTATETSLWNRATETCLI